MKLTKITVRGGYQIHPAKFQKVISEIDLTFEDENGIDNEMLTEAMKEHSKHVIDLLVERCEEVGLPCPAHDGVEWETT